MSLLSVNSVSEGGKKVVMSRMRVPFLRMLVTILPQFAGSLASQRKFLDREWPKLITELFAFIWHFLSLTVHCLPSKSTQL